EDPDPAVLARGGGVVESRLHVGRRTERRRLHRAGGVGAGLLRVGAARGIRGARAVTRTRAVRRAGLVTRAGSVGRAGVMTGAVARAGRVRRAVPAARAVGLVPGMSWLLRRHGDAARGFTRRRGAVRARRTI